MDRVVLSWSGGKDASYALSELRASDEIEVVELLTTVSAATDRVTMHGVRRELVERQADRLGLPLDLVELPEDPSNEEYEAVMAGVMADYAARGIDRIAFADVFLEDVRAYREERLAETELAGLWPIWGRDTGALIESVLDRGFRTTVVAADAEKLPESIVGRELDRDLLATLPPDVDPCGENGEFHTFTWDGPGFDAPVAFETGEVVTRAVGHGGGEFHYVDLLPAPDGDA